ncbi:hypothetical protein J6590_002597 [Homalodisca vitripennis]|nr:hypothetical protein J6590_002597 [Homalodisca vitripennis]
MNVIKISSRYGIYKVVIECCDPRGLCEFQEFRSAEFTAGIFHIAFPQSKSDPRMREEAACEPGCSMSWQWWAVHYSQHSNTVYDWVRDHRVHHKFSETDADPHNSNRGFFFAHVGWLMQRKHPEVLRKGAQVDMSDILADPLVTFHTKHFTLIKIVFCFILPTLIPIYCWGEDPRLMIQGMVFVRYVMGLNFTWLVNSAAHIYGNKPYDKRIKPSQNLSVSLVAMGEGWHNYHHVFPWDYKAAELGNYRANFTTFFIDMFAKIGWAYDLKTASPSMVERVITKHGDGTHPTHEHPHPE